MNHGRTFRRIAVGVATMATVGGAVILAGAAPSQAAGPGVLTISPASGNNNTTISMTTAGPCTSTNATNLQATISGAGYPAGGANVVGNTAISAFQTTSAGGYLVPMSLSLQDHGNQQTPPVVFSGRYDFTVFCRAKINPTVLGSWTGSIWFSDPKTWQNQDPSTTTTVSIAPTQPLNGRTTTLTATVTSAAGTPTGNVTFTDGATTLGTSSLSGGVATLATTLKGGSHTITASYPATGIFFASSGSATTLVQTETALKAIPTLVPGLVPGLKLYSAKLTELVGGAPIGGQTVSFYSGSTQLCTAVTDGTGTAGCAITALLVSPTAVLGTFEARYAGASFYLPAAPSSAGIV